MAGFGANPTTTTQGGLATNQFPLSSVAVPGTTNGDLTALEGGPVSSDSNGNKTAPASMYVKDGSDTAQGTTTDAAWSGAGAATTIALLKKLVAELGAALAVTGSVSVSNLPSTQPVSGTFWQATQPVSGTLTANAGTNMSTASLAQEAGGNLAAVATNTTGLATQATLALAKIDLDNITTNTSLLATHTDASNINATLGTLGTQTTLAAAKADLDTIATNTASLATHADTTTLNTTLGTLGTQATLALVKTDLDTIVTSTNKIPASPAQESGNLASILTQVTNHAVNATLQGGANLVGTIQITGNDGTSKLKVNGDGTVPIVQTDQSTVGTITANGQNVQFDLKDAVGSVEFFLAGTFSASSTIVFEQSADNTNWVAIFGRQLGFATTPPVSSITGPGPLAIMCNGVNAAHVRARCTAFTVADSINVTVRSSVGVTSIAINSSLPPGTAAIGSIIANSGANLNTSLLALEAGGNLATLVANTADLLADGDNLATIATNTTTLATHADASTINITLGTLATQATLALAKTDLDTLVTNTPVKGTAIMTGSVPVTIATDDTQTTAIKNSVANIPAKGAAVTSASMPVTLASDQILPIKGSFTEQAGLTAAAVNADVVPSTDVSAYKWFSLQITALASGTVTFQASNDNINFVSILVYNIANTNTPVTSVTSTTGVYYGMCSFRYLRVRQTSYTSGTTSGTLELYTEAATFTVTTSQAIAQASSTQNGTSDFHVISLASTNANSIKTSGGQIYGYELGNNGATDAWVKFYNASSAPTPGTGTPFRVVYVPTKTRASFHTSTGLAMGTGIGFTITGGAADADTTAVGAAQVTAEIDYK